MKIGYDEKMTIQNLANYESRNNPSCLGCQQAARILASKCKKLKSQKVTTYMRIPDRFRTTHCAKLLPLLTDAYSSKPVIQPENDPASINERPLEWINNLMFTGKVIQNMQTCAIRRYITPEDVVPVATIEVAPPMTPELPIIIEDEEVPIAEISKGSDDLALAFPVSTQPSASMIKTFQQMRDENKKYTQDMLQMRNQIQDIAINMQEMQDKLAAQLRNANMVQENESVGDWMKRTMAESKKKSRKIRENLRARERRRRRKGKRDLKARLARKNKFTKNKRSIHFA